MPRAPHDFHADGIRRPIPAHCAGSNGRAAPEPISPSMPELHWTVSYERADVNRFLAAVDAERARLEEQIATARARIIQARAGVARRTGARAALAARLLELRQELDTMEHQHRRSLETIEAETARATDRLLGAAQDEAAVMRTAATSARGADARPDTPWAPADRRGATNTQGR